MRTKLHTSVLLACAILASSVFVSAQLGKVGAKQETQTDLKADASETEHMSQLITQLKLDVANIQDPEAKKAGLANVELWQHMLDKVMRENPASNNSGPEHHHEVNPSSQESKQSPKPQ